MLTADFRGSILLLARFIALNWQISALSYKANGGWFGWKCCSSDIIHQKNTGPGKLVRRRGRKAQKLL